ncbi:MULTISPECIES: serine--tRNA ligase [Porcipelethomonas]|jgi:seryl-tRNA synthetase|uniref:serine--tRNA ligase n=1 Tax=Porcipelethomonas TaxID=2981643 RepID=UPI00082354AC|nr:serine--tRNA ligase [Porcipelethomonas ammoniilytica]MCU6719169.1 serine--tRNA ligase [Porcipelethomonas ammoniilytica]MEE0186278.1 serine--tRNA ligase [Oscillospiraceae bacterium]OLA00639.1 MAG: serine--tRNA ligase [Clostridiales bacterium Nov_37_41]SCI72583.1 Serine--tRNA ligase [uncultured Ruminococcus sp.]
MLDIKIIRENPDRVKAALKTRNADYDSYIDEILEIDEKRRKLSTETDALKAEQNKVSKQIPIMKKNGENTDAVMAEMKEISEKIKNDNAVISELETKQRDTLLRIPNIPSETTPIGKDDSENVELRKWGEPSKFDFEPLAHWDIGKNLGILDPETAAKVTGARFHFYKGLGARLERAVISYFLNTHTENGYTEVLPPYMVNRASMTGTGQLPKFEEDAFRVANNDYFLIPTAEVPVTNMHRDEILSGDKLPIKYCAYSACFRAEAGSAGRDQRGLIRQHQFNKVELVKFVDPATSYDELEKLTNDAERVLQGLGLPYRVVALSTGDIGFSSAKTYDIEVWMPSYNRYVEISSCSNFEDYQARRAAIRFKNSPKDKAQFVHTLNGSGVAVGRTVAAILENYQNADGSVTIPEALVPFMGTDIIK